MIQIPCFLTVSQLAARPDFNGKVLRMNATQLPSSDARWNLLAVVAEQIAILILLDALIRRNVTGMVVANPKDGTFSSQREFS
jgi:hypothetical protein